MSEHKKFPSEKISTYCGFVVLKYQNNPTCKLRHGMLANFAPVDTNSGCLEYRFGKSILPSTNLSPICNTIFNKA